VDQEQSGKIVRQAELIEHLPDGDSFKALATPYLTLAGQIYTVGTVNRIMGTSYTLETIGGVQDEVIEACLALDAMRHERSR
jgi:hypothetical protein